MAAVTYLTPIKASPYKTISDLSEELGVSKVTIHARKKELEAEKERYGPHTVISDCGIVLINYLAWIDYLKYRARLKEKNLRKTVPPYNPMEVARELGWYGKEQEEWAE